MHCTAVNTEFTSRLQTITCRSAVSPGANPSPKRSSHSQSFPSVSPAHPRMYVNDVEMSFCFVHWQDCGIAHMTPLHSFDDMSSAIGTSAQRAS